MAFRLGIPAALGEATLPRRLAWITGARLLFLLGTLALFGVFYLPQSATLERFSMRTGLIVLCVSFALAGIYAAVLRSGKFIEPLAHAELVLDQLTWTVVVYLSGGASSGATSFYGLSCLVGAILIGLRGAALAGITGGLCYAALLVALQNEWLHAPPDQPPRLYQLGSDELVYYLFVNLLVLVVVTLLAGYLAERLRITGGRLMVAEERAEQAERMAALGRLAAGLAHEIRNPLGSIAGSIQLLKTAPALSKEDRQLCEIVEREAARLNDLVTDMMDLSRPRKPQMVDVNVASTAREVVQLTHKSGRAVSDVSVTFSGPDRVVVRADPGQLRQLIWNLVRNAVQASSAGDDVKVTVSEMGGSVELSVEDRGIGIDAEAKKRLFDAFFTTRSKGTGVGLAVVKRIADEHGFSIDVQSERGRGAIFRVHLGRAVSAPEAGSGVATRGAAHPNV
jgi:signal transduction histidine kinase